MHAESSLYFVLLREGEGRGVWELGGGREGGVVGGGGECESWEGEGSEGVGEGLKGGRRRVEKLESLRGERGRE